MAQKTTVSLLDDLDGSEAAETVEFSIDRGAPFEIDLSEEHAAELRAVFAPYIAVARRQPRNGGPARAPRAGGGPARMDREQSKSIRAWGRANGYTVEDRGRIPQPVIDAYQQHAGRPAA